MDTEDKTAEAAAEAAAETAEQKTRAAGRPASDLPEHATLHFLDDKEGKPFGPSNHPFREGSNRAGRFAHYTDGITVGELLKAGLTRRQIHDHIDAGLVRLEVGPAPEPVAPEPAAA
jgi:hypothetical protein